MHVTVRRYEGMSDIKEAAKRVQESFVPLISAMPGVIDYYWVDLGGGTAISISVFDDLPTAIESNYAAAKWRKNNLASLQPRSARMEAGQVLAHKIRT